MGGVRVKFSSGTYRSAFLKNTIDRIRLRLDTRNISEPEARRLAEIIQANLADHVESGTLISAFEQVHVYQSSPNFTAVGIGDARILTKPKTAPRGTIAEFVEWLRGERSKRWATFQDQWQVQRQKREALQKRIVGMRPKRVAKVVKARKPSRARQEYIQALLEASRIRGRERKIEMRWVYERTPKAWRKGILREFLRQRHAKK